MRNRGPVTSKYVFQQYLQYMDMFISLNKERIGLWHRQRLIIDAKDYTLAHMTKINFVALKKFIQYFQVSGRETKSKRFDVSSFFFSL